MGGRSRAARTIIMSPIQWRSQLAMQEWLIYDARRYTRVESFISSSSAWSLNYIEQLNTFKEMLQTATDSLWASDKFAEFETPTFRPSHNSLPRSSTSSTNLVFALWSCSPQLYENAFSHKKSPQLSQLWWWKAHYLSFWRLESSRGSSMFHNQQRTVWTSRTSTLSWNHIFQWYLLCNLKLHPW